MEDFEQSHNYEMIKERMKERPINRKKLVRRTAITVSMAVIFGVFACITFLVLEPVISNILYPEPAPEEVILPEEMEEILPEDMLITEEKPQPEPTVQVQKYELDVLENYDSTYKELYQLVKKFKRSMVTVTEVRKDVDWFNNAYQNKGQYTGIIFANSKTQFFVLVESLELEQAEEITVTFQDGNMVPGKYIQHDVNLGLSVIAVNMSDISEGTMDVIGVTNLGSSRSASLLASPVIVLGKLYGHTESVAYGMVTTEDIILNLTDCNYELLTTDIYGSEDAVGFVISTSGQLLGVVNQEHNPETTKNIISFVGITEMRRTLERMCNGKTIPYLGVEGMDVTSTANREQGVPLGAYVTEVAIGSPAMKAGIQSGDIITAIDEMPILAFSQYVDVLSGFSPEETVSVQIRRQGANEYVEVSVPITLEERK